MWYDFIITILRHMHLSSLIWSGKMKYCWEMIIWYTACCEVLSTKLSVSTGFYWAVTYLYNFILFIFLYCMKEAIMFHSVYWLLVFPDHIRKSHQLVCLHTGLRKYWHLYLYFTTAYLSFLVFRNKFCTNWR